MTPVQVADGSQDNATLDLNDGHIHSTIYPLTYIHGYTTLSINGEFR